jgi:hypothetical protein
MLENFIESFYKTNMIKGYEIIGRKLTVQFFSLFFLLTLICFYVILTDDWFALFILFRLFITMLQIGDLVDDKLEKHRLKADLRSKEYVWDYLKNTLSFNHSTQYKEFALLLQHHGDKNMKSYNILPYLAISLPVLLFISSFASQIYYPNHLLTITIITVAISILLISLNPLVNIFLKLFRNQKAFVAIGLSDTVHEIYLEESISEHRIQCLEQKMLKETDILFH